MKSSEWIALVSIVGTVTIALINIFLNRRREKLQQERDDKLRKEHEAREDSLLEDQRKREAERQKKERTYIPQIEFNVDCNFYGPVEESYLVEVLMRVNNKGRVQQQFKNVKLRIRGIEDGQPLSFWEGRGRRLYFPLKLVDDEVVPPGVAYFFAEPGEEHIFTYVTKIPSSVIYILAYTTFSYGKDGSHDAERVFAVRP